MTGGTCRFRSVADVSQTDGGVYTRISKLNEDVFNFSLSFMVQFLSFEPHLSLISTVCVLLATGGGKSRPLSRLL